MGRQTTVLLNTYYKGPSEVITLGHIYARGQALARWISGRRMFQIVGLACAQTYGTLWHCLRTTPRIPCLPEQSVGWRALGNETEKISDWMWQNIPDGFDFYSSEWRTIGGLLRRGDSISIFVFKSTTLLLCKEQTMFSYSICLISQKQPKLLVS